MPRFRIVILLLAVALPVFAENPFAPLIGTWTFEGAEIHEDGSRITDKGELRFEWILDGEGVQDFWTETERGDDQPLMLGTTVRFLDSKTNTWSATWFHPRYHTMRALTGHTSGKEIVFEGTSPSGTRFHWIFSEITAGSFRWHAERFNGKEWRTVEDLHARRK